MYFHSIYQNTNFSGCRLNFFEAYNIKGNIFPLNITNSRVFFHQIKPQKELLAQSTIGIRGNAYIERPCILFYIFLVKILRLLEVILCRCDYKVCCQPSQEITLNICKDWHQILARILNSSQFQIHWDKT